MARTRIAAFLSDFTLGFSDGLTVPFALTAGLSSLGRTDTVIYAGFAELCAGCISMGIGGYLSARDAARATNEDTGVLADEERHMLETPRDSEDGEEMGEKAHPRQHSEAFQTKLADLGLSDESLLAVMRLVDAEMSSQNEAANASYGCVDQSKSLTPIVCGLSISFGYIIGGLLPLLPYCFASNVGDGLKWSIIVCLVALFSYGALKDRVLEGSRRSAWRSFWEGLQMVLLGSLAAGAAVLCVALVPAVESR